MKTRPRRGSIPRTIAALVAAGACVPNPYYVPPEIDASASEGGETEAPTSTSMSTTGTSTTATTATTATSTMTSASTDPTTGQTSGTMGSCGDAVVDGDEECDDGPANGPGKECNDQCLYNVCGDGDPGPGEACDDGNPINDDACSNACAIASCGDGIVQPGEGCDDGLQNGPGAFCNALCLPNKCGDGDPSPVEECDDGNGVDLDGCEGDCTVSTPEDVAGLVMWLRVDAGLVLANGRVAVWTDQTGQGNDAIDGVEQPGPLFPSASGPLNGLDVVRFDGPHPIGMRLALPEVVGETVFAVAQSFDYTDNDALLGNHDGYLFGVEILSEGNPYKSTGWDSLLVNNAPQVPIPIKTWHIVDATWPQGKGFKANRLGGVTTDGSRSYSGDLAEMLIYDHPLTAAERNFVGWYLGEKYALMTNYVAP